MLTAEESAAINTPLMDAVLKSVGGLGMLCNMLSTQVPYARAEFLKNYRLNYKLQNN